MEGRMPVSAMTLLDRLQIELSPSDQSHVTPPTAAWVQREKLLGLPQIDRTPASSWKEGFLTELEDDFTGEFNKVLAA